MRQKGKDRLTPNKFDFTLYHSAIDTILLSNQSITIRMDIPNVPGAFLIKNVLDEKECNQILTASESIGYTGDEPLAGQALGQASVLAHNFFWLADQSLLGAIYERCKPHLPPQINGHELTGLNSRWRLYRYVPGAVYRPHIDGAWPCSGLLNGKYVYDLPKTQRSRLTFLVYLNDDFQGGQTTFFLPTQHVGLMYSQAVTPRMGSVVCFPHGDTTGSLLHEGSPVLEGTKYIIRADVLYTIGALDQLDPEMT
jgi:hypothetical protein